MGLPSILSPVFLVPLLAIVAAQAGTAGPSGGAGSKTDAQLLLDFKGTLENGDAVLASWAGTDPCAGWVGVSCDPTGRVTNISLGIKDIQASIPASAWIFPPGLLHLDLHKNQISGSLPEAWRFPEGLVSLELYDNQITGSIPPEWSANLPRSLVTLALDSNQLGGSLPIGLENLPQLNVLYLSRNKLGGSIPRDWALPDSLASLLLHDNELRGSVPNITLPRSLEVLSFDQNRLTGSLPAVWNFPPNISYVYFWQNELTGSLPTWDNVPELQVNIVPGNTGLCGEVPASPQYFFYYYEVGRSTPLAGRLGNCDARALRALRNAMTNGWELLPSWSESLAEPCSGEWEGVTCSSGGQVIELDLRGLGLQGSIPAHGLPPALQRALLSGNRLSGSLPRGWALPANLSEIWLFNNSLTGPLPALATDTLVSIAPGNEGLCGTVPPQYFAWGPSGPESLASLPACPSPPPPPDPAAKAPPSPSPPLPLPAPATAPASGGTGTDNSGGGGSNTAAIAGGVLGGVAAAALLAALGWWFLRSRKTDAKLRADVEKAAGSGASTCLDEKDSSMLGKDPKGPTQPGSTSLEEGQSQRTAESLDSPNLSPSLVDLLPSEPSVGDCLLDFERLHFCKDAEGKAVELGRGAFSTVYRVLLDGVEPAAAKEIQLGGSQTMLSMFLKEVSLLRMLRHRNIVGFQGLCMHDNQGYILMELMEGRDLHTHLNLLGKDYQRVFAWSKRGRVVAVDVARALHYLHSRKLTHFDVKSSNVLLSRDLTAKLADVGFTKAINATYHSLSGNSHTPGTWEYMAPELIMGQKCNSSADVFSFGVLLHEICSGEHPVRGCLRELRVPEDCPPEVAALIKECTAPDPAARPSTRDLVQRLSDLSAPSAPGSGGRGAGGSGKSVGESSV